MPELLDACQTLLRADPNDRASAKGFMIATVYAVRLSYLALAQTAQQMFVGGEWQTGEMALPHVGRDLLLPTAIFARWRG
jgi:23S rRNA (cytosine1962-C5)-methyltransferase